MEKHEKYYLANQKYSDFLNAQDLSSFKKYVDKIISYTKTDSNILDVGCGTGIVLDLIRRQAKRDVNGIEISKTSLQVCKEKRLKCKWYDGKTIPFQDNFFQLVGSFNVLEHTDNPINFLDEQVRVLDENGYLVIVCPNFLSVTNSYHKNTRGFFQKIKNVFTLLSKIVNSNFQFKKMIPTENKNFKPDDDAVNITNPIDIMRWARSRNLDLVYWSSQQQSGSGLNHFLDFGILRCIFGSCFFVFKKG